jgi:plastocyanin
MFARLHRGTGGTAAFMLVAALAGTPALAGAKTHVVTVEGMAFAPAELTVQRGDKVVWRNKDLVPHTATAAGRFDSRNIASEKSWTYVAKTPGRYDYVCTYHPGMKATLVVQ